MAHPAVALLESALRARKLDRTLTTSLPVAGTDASRLAPMEVPGVDAGLRGGLPRGQLSELVGPNSSGRTTLLLQLFAAATRRGEIAALVDTHDRLDVPSAAAAGVELDRLLWIRGWEGAQPPAADRALDRAIKALNLVLQAGGFGIVAIDLADVTPTQLRQLPFTTWPRVQRVIEGSETACVLLTAQPLARSAGGLTLSLDGCATWAGAPGRSQRLQGADLRVRVVSPRKRIDSDVRVNAVATA